MSCQLSYFQERALMSCQLSYFQVVTLNLCSLFFFPSLSLIYHFLLLFFLFFFLVLSCSFCLFFHFVLYSHHFFLFFFYFSALGHYPRSFACTSHSFACFARLALHCSLRLRALLCSPVLARLLANSFTLQLMGKRLFL